MICILILFCFLVILWMVSWDRCSGETFFSTLQCPKCTDGLYAITGNHEFIGGGNRTIPYIESKGIRVLKDEIVTLDGGIQLVGRIDRDSYRFYRKERLSLDALMANVDTSQAGNTT